jgi:hypothetical protein
VSNAHWSFQNKLNKPSKNGDVLVYSSGQDFSIDEADAWWLCYDAIKIVDKELSTSNALLEDLGKCRFEIRRVLGSESPTFLAEHIRPIGWQPINAEIRASDPIQLAETLGGRNLYGPGAFAPLRELLQNSVDAVRARRKHEERSPNWGHIRVILEEDERKETWLHVDDTGIGMSERVLVGPLLDFGRSFWNSPKLREEFPGLERHGIEPIGKFGIGFFAVFLLGRMVKVISRRYDQGLADTRVLAFSSIASRPIIRPAGQHELPADYSTRVSVKIEDLSLFEPAVQMQDQLQFHVSYRQPRKTQVFDWIRNLIVATDVEVEILDRIHNHTYVHHANWTLCPPDQFLNELLAYGSANQRSALVEAHSNLLTTLRGGDGKVYGRAAIKMFETEFSELTCGISVGGFIYRPGMNRFSGRTQGVWSRALNRSVGVFSGSSDDVSRSTARFGVPTEVIAKWASDQAERIEQHKYHLFDLIRVCHEIIRLGGDPNDLPFAYCGGKFISLPEFRLSVEHAAIVLIPINRKYDDGFELSSIPRLAAEFFVAKISNSVVSVDMGDNPDFVDSETGRDAANSAPYELSSDGFDIPEISATGLLIEELKRRWGTEPKFVVDSRLLVAEKTFGITTSRWVLVCERR